MVEPSQITRSANELILHRLDELEAKLLRSPAEILREHWLSGEEVMDLFSISKRTLRSYRDRGMLGFSAVGKKLYYRASEIADHLQRHYQPPFARGQPPKNPSKLI
ncbi:MAG: helix-turn-helix domain-containing protein [Bacteroidota bacterium]